MGSVLTINNERDPLTLKRLEIVRVPCVLLDRDLPLELDAVLTDHAAGMAQATEYLVGLGHRRIALITGGMEIRAGPRARPRLHRDACRRWAWRSPQDLIRAQSLSADYGFRETVALLQRPDRPTALIAAGNRILVGVLRALQEHKVSVPRRPFAHRL